MKENTLKELYVSELRDLYDAEQQLIKALPKMAKASNSEELRRGFEEHLEQTRGHAQRLEQILKRSASKKFTRTSGWSALWSMIWDTSICRRECLNRSKIPSAQKCYPCLRYVV